MLSLLKLVKSCGLPLCVYSLVNVPLVSCMCACVCDSLSVFFLGCAGRSQTPKHLDYSAMPIYQPMKNFTFFIHEFNSLETIKGSIYEFFSRGLSHLRHPGSSWPAPPLHWEIVMLENLAGFYPGNSHGPPVLANLS